MMDSNAQYLKLITSEHANKPKYMAFVDAVLDQITNGTTIDGEKEVVSNGINNIYESTYDLLNVDNAQGSQLDLIGKLVDISRTLPIVGDDIPDVLTDDLYRLVIKAKIQKNKWDGTTEGIYNIINSLFPDISFNIIDNQDMTMQIVIVDPNVTDEVIELFERGFIVPKPAGVRTTFTFSRSPLFGWDLNTSTIKGWGSGVWSNV